MAERNAWESLQSRWASGERLSAEEENERVAGTEKDALARREVELFRELQASLRSGGVPPVGLVGTVLHAHRGSALRLVQEEARSATPRRIHSSRVRGAFIATAAAALLALAAKGIWSGAQPDAPASNPAASVRKSRPLARASARAELVFLTRDVQLDGKQAGLGAKPLAPGVRIATQSGQACVSIDPSGLVCAGPNAEFVLDSLDQADLRVRVVAGAAVAKLSPRAPGHSFSLSTEDVKATARGTVFALARDAQTGTVAVSVLEGEIDVRSRAGSTERLGAHRRLAFAVGMPARSTTLGRAEEAHFWSLLAAQKLWEGNALGVLEITPSSVDQRAWIDGHGSFGLPLAVYAAAGRHEIVVGSPGAPESRIEAALEAGARQRVTVPGSSVVHRSRSPAAHVAQSPGVLLDKARMKLASGDRPGARVLYQKLRATYPGSPEATTVLVTLGKLELDLGSGKRALAAFDEYLKTGGPLGPEALAGRIRALRALGRTDEERRAIQLYLARHPEGFAVPVLRKRLERLVTQ